MGMCKIIRKKKEKNLLPKGSKADSGNLLSGLSAGNLFGIHHTLGVSGTTMNMRLKKGRVKK